MNRYSISRSGIIAVSFFVAMVAGSGSMPTSITAADHIKHNNKSKRQYLSQENILKLAQTVAYKNKKYNNGDRVITLSWAGTCKTNESGYSIELQCDAGHAGTVLGGAADGVAMVRWDRQIWSPIKLNSKDVFLEEFDSEIHIDYLGPAE